MTRSFAVPAALVIALTMSLPALGAERAFDRSFEVPSGGRLKVEAESGSIAVTGSATGKVVVRIRATGSDDRIAKLRFSAERDAEGVAVSAKREDRAFNWFGDAKVAITVEVPRSYNVDLNTSGGNLEVRHLDGTTNGRTSGGRITVEEIQGPVHMRTSGGGVTARAIRGQTQLHTSGGAIVATQIDGGLKVHTSGGSIRIEQATGAIDAHTSGGSINIDTSGANAGIVARTSGGSINLIVPATINATLNASTSGGRVSSNLPMTTSESGKSSLRGTVNGGGPEILARSSGGSITIAKRE